MRDATVTLAVILIFILLAFVLALIAAIEFYRDREKARQQAAEYRHQAGVRMDHYRAMQEDYDRLLRANKFLREQVKLLADDGEGWKLGRREEE